MPTMKNIKKHNDRYESSSSSSDCTSSSSSDSEEMRRCRREKRQKHEKKHHKRSHSSSSSSSNSSSHSNSSKSSSCSKSSRTSKSSKSSKSSHSDSEHSHCNFEALYKYYKHRLLHDNELMVAGSNAYTYSNNVSTDTSLVLPRSYSTEYANNLIQYNIDSIHPNAPFFVRDDGIYVIIFTIADDNPSQWTIFVNGKALPSTTTGTNSGAGQLNCRRMIALKKNDAVVIRNYTSNASAVTTVPYAGGSLPGNDLIITIKKIAPFCPPQIINDCDFEKKCHKNKKLYRKLLERLLCDKELMMKGFNVHGSFFSYSSYEYYLGEDIKFDNTSNLSGLEMTNGVNPSGSACSLIKVLEEGVYDLLFFIDTTTACQFSYCVNGVPIEFTTQGTNRGSGQLSLHAFLNLNKNDVVTVRNWKSNTAKLITQEGSGGNQAASNAILTMFKFAPLDKPSMAPVECHIPERYKKCYEQFRQYLLRHEKLQIAGAPVLLSTVLSTYQKIPVNDSIDWDYNIITREARHLPGTAELIVERDGIYNFYFDLITDEPAQTTVFVNGVPDLTTTSGRDSGSTRVSLRQFMQLSCGDVLTVRNYESNAGTLNVARNPGGIEPGCPASLMLLRLSHDNCYHHEHNPPALASAPVDKKEEKKEEKKEKKEEKKDSKKEKKNNK